MEFGKVSKGFGLKQSELDLHRSQVPLWVSFTFGCQLTGGTGSSAAVTKAAALLCLTGFLANLILILWGSVS